jgi:tricorn protease
MVNFGSMEILVDPRAEWEQMFEEVWRIERDFFYDPNMHGADWEAMREKYRPFLAHVGHRSDLNFVFAEMIGEMVVGHNYVGGGDMPQTERVSGGLLGADLVLASGLYRIERIYTGENWNPDLRAPLTEPGVDVSEGDYLISVNGKALTAEDNIFAFFENTSGRQTVIEVNAEPTAEGARQVTVVPIGNDGGLRHRAWVEGNRRKVDAMTDGKVGYVYLPNTAYAGYTAFNRYYFAQQHKKGMVIDERFNGGGSAADYIVDLMDRPILNYVATREGKVQPTPSATIQGPKAMIINEYAGSGGDALPYYFRLKEIGKLVGKRTWGGLVGIYDYPRLMDGGFIMAPRIAFFDRAKGWIVENEGVPPDIDVEMTPKLVIEGHDPQLEEAVRVVLEELERGEYSLPEVPEYPNRVR